MPGGVKGPRLMVGKSPAPCKTATNDRLRPVTALKLLGRTTAQADAGSEHHHAENDDKHMGVDRCLQKGRCGDYLVRYYANKNLRGWLAGRDRLARSGDG